MVNDPRFIEALPPWPGLHPGTGYTDHPHSVQRYRAVDATTGEDVAIEACHICGWPLSRVQVERPSD